MNETPFYCKQDGCKCLVLKAGIGRSHIASKETLDLLQITPEALCFQLDNAMCFENVAFSKEIKKDVCLLACADCDKGPFGVHYKSEKLIVICKDLLNSFSPFIPTIFPFCGLGCRLIVPCIKR